MKFHGVKDFTALLIVKVHKQYVLADRLLKRSHRLVVFGDDPSRIICTLQFVMMYISPPLALKASFLNQSTHTSSSVMTEALTAPLRVREFEVAGAAGSSCFTSGTGPAAVGTTALSLRDVILLT